jgi:photosystem II stability/assembly factor-like uncharacterized protein
VTDIEFDPANPATIYAAAATGGIFKSSDSAVTWTPIFDEQAVLTAGDVAISPHNSSVLYVGTGEANGGHNNFAGGGVFKSEDGGETWRFLGLAETASIGRIVVDHSEPERVFVAAVGSYFGTGPHRGVFRSNDGGASWERVLFVNDSTGVIDLVQHAANPSILLAATWERVRRPEGPIRLYGSASGIYRSTDGGDTWTRIRSSSGLPDPDAYQDGTGRARFGRIGLTIGRSDPSVAYALYTDGWRYLGLFRSRDAGLTWMNADSSAGASGAFGDFSWYLGQVRVHPASANEVYVLDVQIGRSDDSGASWTVQSGTHVDHHALAFHPTDDGGIAVSKDRGRSWTRAGNLPITQFYEIAYARYDPERVSGGTQDNGTVQTLPGRPDIWQTILGGDGFYVVLDPEDPGIVYAETQFGRLRKSLDGGLTFREVLSGIPDSEKRNWSTPVVMDPRAPEVLYYGATRVYRTLDGARFWTAVSGPLSTRRPSDRLGTITSIAVSPSDSRVLYAGTDDGNVWVTIDRAESWTRVSATLPIRWVTRLAVDPDNPATAWVTFSGLKWRDPQPHVFRTDNYGTTWSDASGNLPDAPVNAITIDPEDGGSVFVGTDVGAFASYDHGASWYRLGQGLPAVPVSDLEITAERRQLLAGTYGRSVYGLDLGEIPTGLEVPSAYVEHLELEAFPNPFSGILRINVDTVGGGRGRVDVFDMLGRRVRTFDLGNTAGPRARTLEWDGTGMSGLAVASGAYVIRVATDAGFSRSVMVVHTK